MTSALELRGLLNVGALQTSLTEVVRRHEALRTRIVVRHGTPIQSIAGSVSCDIQVDDLVAVPECEMDAEVQRRIDRVILEPIDISKDRLFEVRLLKLSEGRHVLIVAMEHMISDGFSLGIMNRELFAAYAQIVTGRPVSLPPIPVQFGDFASWQRESEASWVQRHGAYWHERLTGCDRVRFPEDEPPPRTSRGGIGVVSVRIVPELTVELQQWCRVRRTTLAMSVFAAYVALVLRWCNLSDAVFQYVSDCRFSPTIQNTIGYFAAPLYLRIQLPDNGTFSDLTRIATEEYCRAYEHVDRLYIASSMPRPGVTFNTAFNWRPQAPFRFDFPELRDSEHALTCAPWHVIYPNPIGRDIDIEPFILLADGREVVGDVYFPRARFAHLTMERFARNFLMLLTVLLRQPERRIKDIAIA